MFAIVSRANMEWREGDSKNIENSEAILSLKIQKYQMFPLNQSENIHVL